MDLEYLIIFICYDVSRSHSEAESWLKVGRVESRSYNFVSMGLNLRGLLSPKY